MNDFISIDNTQKRLVEIDNEIGELKSKQASLKDKWMAEKSCIQSIRTTKEKIESEKRRADEFERLGDLASVAEIRYSLIYNLEIELKKYSENLAALQSSGKMLKEEVDASDIAEILAKWTGIPVKKLLESERAKLLQIEDIICERVIGQDEAALIISNSIRRSRAGLQDPNRPIGSFIFLGSTGVGKTELAKTLAQFLFDDEQSIVRIDMSEYMDKFSISKLIGAPPGYIGYDEGGQLTESVRRRPYSVVLLDEIEKAHSDIFNILLQVLDDGRLTDGKGRTVNFKNTIIIMTSNLGSDIISSKLSKMSKSNRNEMMIQIKAEMQELLRTTLKPEFLNRIDEIVVFNPLSATEVMKIAKLQLDKLSLKLAKDNITLTYSQSLLQKIAKAGFDLYYGARPLKRTIQKLVIDPLSIEILSGRVSNGRAIDITCSDNDNITFSIT